MPSEIADGVPAGCEVTFASVLSRHGARDPTSRKTELYRELIERIQSSVEDYGDGFEFLKDYEYTLGSDQLTYLGQQQLVDEGLAFYTRYTDLAERYDAFIRAAGSDRVIESAVNFTQGLYSAQERNVTKQIERILIVPETEGFNNTLHHGTCPEFENGLASEISNYAQRAWMETWVPSVMDRLNEKLPGANISLEETIYMMDLCPFNTVANRDAEKSEFCRLFSDDEWENYDYFESLDKWYGYGSGNPLGPTQGVGYVNELISRLTGNPVKDDTTTNSTLDDSRKTFPLNRRLYADFSHDNDMSSIYAAMGLYNSSKDLSVEKRMPPETNGGFSAAWTVPFAGRMYVEKMRCGGEGNEELVRVLVNDRVIPLQNCEADSMGRCGLSAFVNSLSFARSGGLWHECFT